MNAVPSMPTPFRCLLVPALAVLLAACASAPARVPEPLRPPLPPPTEAPAADAATDTRVRIADGPLTEAPPTRVIDPRRSPVRPGGRPVALALDAVNLTAFIDEVFGTQLGFSLEIEQAVRDKPELVSLRLIDPEPPARLYEIAVEVLKSYGVAVVEEKGRLRFTVQPGVADPPRLLTGRTLPEVPQGQRPIFVVMPLDVAHPGEIGAQLRNLYGTASGVTVAEMLQSNALLISGPPALVEAAMEAVQLFDRAAFRDKRALRITPLYLPVDVLARELRAVLVGQGYSVRYEAGSSGVLSFVPVASANALVIFSESAPALDAAARWAETLDQPPTDGGPQAGAYVYAVRNTTAESLRATAEALIGATSAPPAGAGMGSAAGAGMGSAAGAGAAASTPQATGGVSSSVGADGSRMVVDAQRNAIIFQGDAARWRSLQAVLARLDQPARQVLVEVTLAEVTLEDEFSHGVEWALRSVGIEGLRGGLTALRGTAGSAGVVWSPISSTGQTRALISLLQTSGHSRLLSTPRLMVRSGETARIDVGDEVPIITSLATAPDLVIGPRPSILQQVQYRSTGVLLEITPIVHSTQRVDLRISQEVSEVAQTTSSTIDSPTISNRRLQTSLSLNDGEPMIMGGLIRDRRNTSRSDVPGLGQLPLLGNLFSSRSRDGRRTELVLLVTPYIVEDASQARALTDAVRARMEAFEGEPAASDR